MKPNPISKQPSHHVYMVEGEGESAYWTRIGAAWQHEDGDGFNVKLSAIPTTGRIVIRKPKPQEQEGGR